MKKVILLCMLCAILITSTLSIQAVTPADVIATDTAADRVITILENGDYIVETLYVYEDASHTRSTTQSKLAKKDFVYFNEDDEALFSFTLEALFEIEIGVSAACTSTGYSYSVYDSAWERDTASHWYQGNTAYAEAVFKRKILFVTTSTVEFDLHISCDVQGNFY